MTDDTPTPPNSAKTKQIGITILMIVIALTVTITAIIVSMGGTTQAPSGTGNTVRPPIIFISIDTLRADRVGAWGSDNKTPALDSLVKDGVRFENCFTPNPLTLPAHTTMLTGTLPLFHRVRDNTYHQVPSTGLATLPEALKEASYQACAGFVSSEVMAKESGIARGFDHWDDTLEGRKSSPSSTLLLRERHADETLGLAKTWIEQQGKDSWMAFIHLFDPHFPYWPKDASERGLTPPQDFTPATLNPLYNAEVEYTDRQLGLFLQALKDKGIYDKALIVVTADHGEGLGDNGELTHGSFIFDATTHVPLIIKLPGGEAASTTVKSNVSLVDLMPTIVELAGVKLSDAARAQQQGQSLANLFRVSGQLVNRSIYIESHYGYLNSGWGRLRAIRNDTHLHVISGGKAESYADGKVPDLLAATSDQALRVASGSAREQLQTILTTHFPTNIEKVLRERESESVKDLYASTYMEHEDAYAETYAQPYSGESLNDVAVVKETLSDDEGRISPHKCAEELAKTQLAQLYFSEGRFQLALEECKAILASTPESLQANKLAALAAWRLVLALGKTSPKRSHATLKEATTYLQAARTVASGLGMKSAALDMELTIHWQRIMLGEDLAGIRDELQSRVAALIKEPGQQASFARRLLRAYYVSAYQLATNENGRGEIAAMWQTDLKKLGIELESQSVDRVLLQTMLTAQPIYPAPWEQ